MGALPSRETQQRGLYSHRHGRNRRSEIILIPLTSTFFPSPDCPLFQHLYNARYRRTAKYYYRALRSAKTSRESDYFCTSSQISEPEEFARFNEERLKRKAKKTAAAAGPMALGGVPVPAGVEGRDSEPKGTAADDYDYQSYTDTPEGLYQVLIAENDLCVHDTDEQLREAYLRQVQHQRAELDRVSERFRHNTANPASNPQRKSSGGGPDAGLASDLPAAFENVPYDAFLSGYAAAKRYMKGKRLHTHVNTKVVRGDPDRVGTEGEAAERGAASRPRRAPAYCTHVTSPAAYYIHPIPCAIASRWDANKPAPVDDPLYVPFEGFYVKVMGMFGVFPSTVVMRSETGAQGPRPRPFPRKEGNPGDGGGGRGDRAGAGVENDEEDEDEVDPDVEVEQHLLKGTMFVDKDVGDQILGNVVMLATHMYVRQCVRAHIQPRHIPMLPFLMRFPLSNIPMLQFVREFRVRLRTLLEAGTAKSGQKPMHVGMSGFNPMDIAEAHDQARAKREEEGYLFEEDVPNITADPRRELFLDPAEGNDISFVSHRVSINTNEGGRFPIFMLSGFNVQSTPLRHPALNDTGYAPARPRVPAAGFPSSAPPSYPGTTSGTMAGAGPPPCPPVLPSSPTMPFPLPVQSSTAASEARKSALLLRRKNRFRMWIEDGHVCLWASAAYARRACLLLAQQLNTTVDSHSVPEQRSWVLRGLLRAGTPCVPAPKTVNDVLVVGEDIPAAGLWQGDVLRCCTREEQAAMRAGLPLPLPCRTAPGSTGGGSGAETGSPTAPMGTPDSPSQRSVAASGGSATPANGQSTVFGPGAVGSGAHGVGGASLGAVHQRIGTGGSHFDGQLGPDAVGGGHVNFTSAHPSNPLLQEQQGAPENAFWVRACGGLDDSYTNISESNMPPHPKMARQLQQAAQQRVKKLAAAAAALSRLHNTSSSTSPFGPTGRGMQGGGGGGGDAHTSAAAAAASLALAMASDFLEIDRREGTLNLEEVALAWVRIVSMLSRESSSETDGDWVRDPHGYPVRIDRFVFRRLEFEGVRFFIGVTPRFVGQQRRIEKVLGEVYALERRAGAAAAGEGGTPSPRASSLSASLIGAAALQGSRPSPVASAGGAGSAEMRDLLAGLGSGKDAEAEEDYEDVLERMGFGPRKLREALERSAIASTQTGVSVPATAREEGAVPTGDGGVSTATVAGAGVAGGGKAGATPAILGAPRSAGEDDQDLLQRFKYEEFLLPDD